MQKSNKKIIGFNIIEVIIIIIITGIVSAISTGIITVNNFKTSSGHTYSELLEDNNIKEFLDVYSDVLSNYYEDVNKEEVINSAISGMMNYLGDKYTTYLDDNETDNLNDMLAGKYNGIGILLNQDLIIQEVFEDSPASIANLQVGDKIVEVLGQSTQELQTENVTSLIKGKVGNINMKVLRGEEVLDINVEVKEINKPAINYSIINNNDKNYGYLYIETFSSTVCEQVDTALKKMEEQNIEGLIIDLRGNGGGYLVAASDTASLFLEKGKTIYSLETKDKLIEYKDETEEKKNYKIAVLVDNGTASAAEVLASALKDSYNATIIGKTTYGKGKVQQTKSLSDGSMVKYTTARWLRATGECVDQVGITPDFEEEIEIIDENSAIDNQYKKAIEVLSQE